MTILERLGQRSKSFLLTLGFLLVVLQSVINYLIGPDITLFIFYLLPVSLVAWLVSRRAAILVVDKSGGMVKTIEHGYHHPEMSPLRK